MQGKYFDMDKIEDDVSILSWKSKPDGQASKTSHPMTADTATDYKTAVKGTQNYLRITT